MQNFSITYINADKMTRNTNKHAYKDDCQRLDWLDFGFVMCIVL